MRKGRPIGYKNTSPMNGAAEYMRQLRGGRELGQELRAAVATIREALTSADAVDTVAAEQACAQIEHFATLMDPPPPPALKLIARPFLPFVTVFRVDR